MSRLFVCLFFLVVSRISEKFIDVFSWNLGKTRLLTGEELIKFSKWSVTYSGCHGYHEFTSLATAELHWMMFAAVLVQRSIFIANVTYLLTYLLICSHTCCLPMSVWHDRGLHSTECSLTADVVIKWPTKLMFLCHC